MKAIRSLKSRIPLVRNTRAMNQLEIFLVSAVSTILLIRLSLEATGYPQLGNDKLHIAHMLWGGLGMLVAALLRLMLMGKWVEYASAFIGGAGFGAFIDEIGKFVTKDNNYFFAPSFSLMYVIFVLVYIAAHWALTSRGYSQTEYQMNAVNFLQEYRNGFLHEDQKQEIRYLLGRSRPEDPLTIKLGEFIEAVATEPPTGPGYYQRLKMAMRALYYRVIKTRYFAPLLNIFFIIELVIGVGYIVSSVIYPQGLTGEPRDPTFSEISLLISSSISSVFTLLGVLLLRRSRLSAYKMFERAMLVNILLSQIFLFTIDQLGAVTGLVFSLLVLASLRFLIEQEESKLVSETVTGG